MLGTVGGECTPGRVILPEWCCLEGTHLVQDQDANSQEWGELPEAHDTSLQGKNDVPTAVKISMSPWIRVNPNVLVHIDKYFIICIK